MATNDAREDVDEPADIEGESITRGNAPDEGGSDKNSFWNVINIHRPIASFWFNYVFLLAAAVPALLMYSWLLPSVILPFPDAFGYQALVVNFFGLFFSIMDVATGPACERYVAQYGEINPQKALKYIQFFIWFQMFTGAVQVTVVAVFCFTTVVNTSLNYAMWFFLTYSLTQFPGMLGAFNSTLKGYQRFDKANVVDLVQTIVFETVTQLVAILIGRWAGAQNPALGELYGATIGYIIGKYIDDFIAMLLAAKFLSKVLEPYGIRLRDAVVPAFGRDVAKESLVYGTKLLGSTVISAATEYVTLLMMVSWLPNYVFITGLVMLARDIAGIVGTKYNYSALISESYNNGKKALAKYSITQYWNSWWFLGFFLAVQITILIPPVFEKLGGNFEYTAVIIPIYILPRLLVTPAVMGADVCQAVNKPEYRTWGIVSEKVTKMLTVFLFLSPWGFRNVFGETSLLTLYILHDIPAYIVITFVEFGLVHKRCVPVKINLWQTLGAGSLASLPLVPVDYLIVWVLDTAWVQTGGSLGVAIAIITGSLVLLFAAFPVAVFFFYAFLGGMDSRGLEHYGNAVSLTGPSKPFVKLFYRAARLGFRFSPVKDRFRTPWEDADKEAAELNAMRYMSSQQTHKNAEY
ncbi:MAG: hypothetical protein JW839_14760 [Candidatus Lokiarchaeota archaeon]|nr:hypothetical protein [Candidatus Lokiarchaeota archaeon]